MNDTTYVGMRYVPVFADPPQWDISRQFENLTMVTADGETYISKKLVPTGVAITNEEYWVKISVPSGGSSGGGGYQYSDIEPVDTGKRWVNGEIIWAWKFNNIYQNYSTVDNILPIDMPSPLSNATILSATIIHAADGATDFPSAVYKTLAIGGPSKLNFLLPGSGSREFFNLDDYIVFEFVVEGVTP